jgi:hypothetical protein
MHLNLFNYLAFGKVYTGTWQGVKVAVKALTVENTTELLREAAVLK